MTVIRFALMVAVLTAAAEAQQAPRFADAPCPFAAEAEVLEQVRCGYLIVPENRSATDGLTLRLAVAIIKSLSPAPQSDPTVFLAGGPGSGIVRSTPAFVTSARRRAARLERDVIFFDQRGTGNSEPRFCPDVEFEFLPCREELWGVASYVNGWQARFTDLAIIQPVGTDTLRALALARARAIGPWIDAEITNLRQGLTAGYSSPQVIVRNVIRQVDDLLATPVRASPFYSPALRDSTPEFAAALAGIIEAQIHPAMRRYRDFLQQEYLDKAREALGVTANADGVACYAATIRSFATVEVPPDTVFAQGLAEMARIEGEMREIAERSFGGESLATLLPRLRTEPRYTFTTSQEIIDSSEAILRRAKTAMGQWFGRLPRADMIIQPYPEFRQRAGAPGQYQPAPEDGSRPAIFLINPSDPTRKARADIETTALHEGIPGHHLQVAIANEQTDVHPLIRYSFSSGFGEGWALYAERLGDEMGLFSSDVARMGMLGSEAFRAARMVIDAGIHTKGWSREQALEHLLSRTFLTRNVAEGEVDRYISWPGQAPSYMIGRNEIMRLRERARTALGDRFDIRVFHDRVLENGTVPLATLRTVVDGWIEAAR